MSAGERGETGSAPATVGRATRPAAAQLRTALRTHRPERQSPMRVFIATELPPALHDELGHLQTTLRTKLTDAKITWVQPSQMHLTFRFFAEASEEQIAHLTSALQTMSQRLFSCQVEGVGVFPERGQPRIVWVGITQGREALCALASALDAALNEAGFPPEERPFHPHVTLGRIKSLGAPSLREVVGGITFRASQPLEVASLCLIRSQLTPPGPVYTTLFSTKPRTHT